MIRGLPPRSKDCIGTCLIDSVWIVECNSRVQVFPWEFAEVAPREFLNMFGPTAVVSIGAGGGRWLLACARSGVRGATFCKTQEHQLFVDTSLTVRVLYEMLGGTDAGFLVKRFLRREQSLGEHDNTPKKRAADNVEPATPAMKKAAVVTPKNTPDKKDATKSDSDSEVSTASDAGI